MHKLIYLWKKILKKKYSSILTQQIIDLDTVNYRFIVTIINEYYISQIKIYNYKIVSDKKLFYLSRKWK